MKERDVYIFGTCRIKPTHKNIKFIKINRKHHSNYYKTDNGINIYTQPVNYTTKLSDILDSIYYMNNKLYNNLNPKTNKMLQNIFFRGHTQPPINFINPNTHPSLDITKKIKYYKIIIEVFSIKTNIINTRKYGEEFYLKQLPWKIDSGGYEHNDMKFNEKNFIVKKLTKNECFDILNKIKKEVNCDIMIIGPYVSKMVPEFVNNIRIETQNILKEFCSTHKWTYFDLSETIRKYNIEKDATHFNEIGKEILGNEMYKFIIK